MKLGLDTDVAIEILRGARPHYRVFLEDAEAEGAELCLSAIVVHELMYGAMISARPGHHLERVEWLATRMRVEPWSLGDAAEAARVRADLKRQGNTLGGLDALIAGQAINRGWALVTNNTRDFFRVSGLPLVDWSDPAGARALGQESGKDRK